MSDTGWKSPGTVVNDSSVGTKGWMYPENAKVEDGNQASGGIVPGEHINYLKATNFGFSIPSTATIDGIVVEIKRRAGLEGYHIDEYVKIVKGGNVGSENKADTTTPWTEVLTYIPYGNDSSLWGESWSVSDINSTNFGVAFTYLAGSYENSGFVDHIRIKVYYTINFPIVGEKYPLPPFRRVA